MATVGDAPDGPPGPPSVEYRLLGHRCPRRPRLRSITRRRPGARTRGRTLAWASATWRRAHGGGAEDGRGVVVFDVGAGKGIASLMLSVALPEALQPGAQGEIVTQSKNASTSAATTSPSKTKPGKAAAMKAASCALVSELA